MYYATLVRNDNPNTVGVLTTTLQPVASPTPIGKQIFIAIYSMCRNICMIIIIVILLMIYVYRYILN